ncbi:hypothetical protein [Streptomyces sp. NPDC046909]|uniref:hypothetical protein n=1 Tax=Streptomyces sp. NPDC046909 TaxID=3155617 RepID=UPI003405A6F0
MRVLRVGALAIVVGCALTSCDIPATGVVEAGGPASGVPATTPVYFVRDGALVVVPRTVAQAGDLTAAVETLFQGPTSQERRKGLGTLLPPLRPDIWNSATVLPTPAEAVDSAEPTGSGEPTESAKGVEVTGWDGRVSVELPWYGSLSSLAVRQVICTAARAYLLSRQDLDSTTVTVNDTRGQIAKGTDEHCPDL